ncbi:hypothetical protein [Streptomyces sp. ISL-100]|uniref:hypothetical protein n=1 Tax=Streptomyces sp. ISL-100 TaxID=2819173 RepID=UPI001BED1C4A|nr:hypothetical protein [Streptomyces sp. ISL-100]MBT2396450.1 hypothetical protein [Streptomyces sp. ISL-100]
MARTARQILNGLSHQRTIHIRSTAELGALVDSAAAAIDKQRREKGQEAVRRKPELHPVARAECGRSIELTPWQVLHALARGFVLPSQGMGRGLAEHWLSLKYCETLHSNRAGSMDLTEKGRSSERWYKAMQARELAVGFGLASAEHIVQQRYPDHIVSVVDASTVLRAGWALGGSQRGKGARPRPDYLVEAWKPGEPSKVTFVVCRGNHQKPNKRTGRTRSTTLQQLVKGSELTEGIQIGPWNTTPCLMLSTELMGQGGVVVNALQSPGEMLLPLRTPDGPGSADEEIRDKTGIPYPNAIHIPAREGKRARTVDGFQVPEKDLGWFGQLLARTGAAGLTAFSGGGPTTARYLTAHQGQAHYAAPTFAATSSYHDADIDIGDTKFVGTDHVFRMETVRIEAFSGMDSRLYELIADGRLEEYRQAAYELRPKWHNTREAGKKWNGPISFHDDGTVMALSILPIHKRRPL